MSPILKLGCLHFGDRDRCICILQSKLRVRNRHWKYIKCNFYICKSASSSFTSGHHITESEGGRGGRVHVDWKRSEKDATHLQMTFRLTIMLSPLSLILSSSPYLSLSSLSHTCSLSLHLLVLISSSLSLLLVAFLSLPLYCSHKGCQNLVLNEW